MLRFRFPRCPPFRICFRELAPSELKHAFADAGSAPGNLEFSQCQSFLSRLPLYTLLADVGRTPCRNIVYHLEQPDQAPRKLEGAG